MNVSPDALTRAYAFAYDSGKVDTGRLARALALVPQVVKTFTHVYTDKSRVEEYWIPGSQSMGYVVTVRNGHTVSGCTCADSQQRETAYCKHRLAVMLIMRAESIMPGSVKANAPIVADIVTVPMADVTYRRRMLNILYPQD